MVCSVLCWSIWNSIKLLYIPCFSPSQSPDDDGLILLSVVNAIKFRRVNKLSSRLHERTRCTQHCVLLSTLCYLIWNHSHKREKSKRFECDDDERKKKFFVLRSPTLLIFVVAKFLPGRKNWVINRWDCVLYSPDVEWCLPPPYLTQTRLLLSL